MEFASVLLVFYIVVGIGAIIFVHELGHFVTAKLSGVRVEAFSLGFYPTFIGIRRSLDGLVVGLLPGRFRRSVAEVGGIEEGTPADEARLRIGDRILEIDGKPVGRRTLRDLDDAVAGASGTIRLKVLRRGETQEVELRGGDTAASMAELGILPPLADQRDVLLGSGDAWVFGLAPGERVVRAADRTIAGREEFKAFADEAVRRGAGIVRLDVTDAEDGEVTRRLAVAVHPQASEPALSVVVPVLKGVPGETEYRLSALPIGGYVKMAGDIPGETTGAKDEFLGKSVGQRGMVFAAGSIMNAIFGCLCFILAYQVGVQSVAPVVGDVIASLPAAEAGVRRGDRVVEVNGKPVHDFFDIPQEVAYANPDAGLRFVVERDGQRLVLPPPGEEAVENYYSPADKRQVSGVQPFFTNRVEKMVVEREVEGKEEPVTTPFYEAGVRPKDFLVALAGKSVTTRREAMEALDGFLGTGADAFEVTVERDGETLAPFTVKIPGDAKRVWKMGITVEWRFEVEKVDGSSLLAGRLETGDVILGAGTLFQSYGFSGTLHKLAEKAEFPFPLEFPVERGGDKRTVEFEAEDGAALTQLAASVTAKPVLVVLGITARSHMGEAGVKPGDEILAMGGAPLVSQADLLERMNQTGDEPIEVVWRAAKSGETKSAKVSLVPSWNVDLQALGIEAFREQREFLRLSFFPSLAMGVQKSWKFASDVFRTLKGIFITRSIGGESLGGPVMIAVASYAFAEYGIGKLLFFLGLLSINLAIINLLPIPILDGGHLMFLAIEKIKGSPVSETAQAIAQYAGLLILLSLMIYVTWNDIERFLT